MSQTSTSIAIRIPTPLRAQAGQQSVVDVTGSTVADALQDLVAQYPDLEPNLYGEDGRLRSFVNIYIGDEDIRYLQGEDTPVSENDELAIVPSVAGGIDT